MLQKLLRVGKLLLPSVVLQRLIGASLSAAEGHEAAAIEPPLSGNVDSVCTSLRACRGAQER